MIDLDFAVFALPRSGTHMMAFALDSHPEINCKGEVWCERYPDKFTYSGRIKGAIVGMQKLDEYMSVPKAIILTRPPEQKLLSRRKQAFELHYFRPAIVNVSDTEECHPRVLERIKENVSQFYSEARKHKNYLEVDYDTLCNNKDVRSFPQGISFRICDFLGVERRILQTKTHKAKVVCS